ncbi:hypothetical protein [Streptomyces sp. NPDC001678]|uniref:hypothetical protein n=1 Tax=Streptomyces sp. NPDC001678 TaxID=3364599 RepID=UPI0036960787
MTTWGLVVETTTGSAERKHWTAAVVAHVEGTREEALRELEARARRHVPQHPFSPRRTRLLRTADGFAQVVDGAWDTFITRFSVAELLYDSDPRPPEPDDPEPPLDAYRDRRPGSGYAEPFPLPVLKPPPPSPEPVPEPWDPAEKWLRDGPGNEPGKPGDR